MWAPNHECANNTKTDAQSIDRSRGPRACCLEHLRQMPIRVWPGRERHSLRLQRCLPRVRTAPAHRATGCLLGGLMPPSFDRSGLESARDAMRIAYRTQPCGMRHTAPCPRSLRREVSEARRQCRRISVSHRRLGCAASRLRRDGHIHTIVFCCLDLANFLVLGLCQ